MAEKLICDCFDENDNPVNTNHVQSMDVNNDVIIECMNCGRFLKVKEPQPDVKHKEQYLNEAKGDA